MADHVDLVLDQWRERRPDLDASPLAAMGRLRRSNADHSLTPAGLAATERETLADTLRKLLESPGDTTD